jgi:hypothetical protein
MLWERTFAAEKIRSTVVVIAVIGKVIEESSHLIDTL